MNVIQDFLTKEMGYGDDEILATLDDWEIINIEDDSGLIGEVMMKNNEVHFAIRKDKRLKLGTRKQLMKKVFSRLYEGKEFLVTKVFKDEPAQKLLMFFGFEKINEDDQTITYWMNKEDCRCLQSR